VDEISTSTPCPKCSTAVFADAAFCHACGSRINRESTSPDGTGKRFAAGFVGIGNAIGNLARDPRNRDAITTFVSGTATSVAQTARGALGNPVVQKVAGGAVLGMGVAAILPVVTLSAGAAVGAALVGYPLLTRQEK
jgi:hypothetical protein